MKKAISRITEYADKSGIKVNDKQLCLKMVMQGHATFGREGGHLTDEQIEKIKEFTSDVLAGFQD
jgi:hypothetical protein